MYKRQGFIIHELREWPRIKTRYKLIRVNPCKPCNSCSHMAEGHTGSVSYTHLTGRGIKSYTREWAKGYQEIVLNKSELGGKGLMYYQFESDYFTANKRMIIMD